MDLLQVLNNRALIASLLAWGIAQVLKMPVEYFRARKWNWALLLRAGGMPSSHSALVASIAHGVGLTAGFGSASFGLAVVLAMIVIYDAAGIRRQAGLHAELINLLIRDLREGYPLRHRKELSEVLGHSPLEAMVGVLLGIAVAQIVFLRWPG